MAGIIVKHARACLLAILVGGVWPAQAQAKPQFAAYEGDDAVQQGRGGTRVTRNGMEFWTTGAPPRPYHITGVIIDRTCLGIKLCGDPIDRPAIAEAARRNGADAVIVIGKSSDVRGMVGGASSYGGPDGAEGFGWSAALGDHAARMLVVKYLPDPPRRP